jgi:hypothetical protein
MNRRHYRTHIGLIILYPFCVVGVVLGLLVTLVPRGGVLLHIMTAGCVLGALWLTGRVKRLGVLVTSENITVYNTYYTRRIAWVDVGGFDTRRWVLNREVGIQLRDGSRIHTSLLQGRFVTWSGGKTRDIISVLQADLDSRADTQA